MRIEPLADCPDAIQLLAEWLYTEWHSYDGRSHDDIVRQLSQNLNRDSIPITFIALNCDEVIGTVSLDESDLPAYDHLSPWLSSLYVAPSYRRDGVGRALVKHLLAFARARAISPLYLWTPNATEFFERLGWRSLQLAAYSHQPITVMRYVAK